MGGMCSSLDDDDNPASKKKKWNFKTQDSLLLYSGNKKDNPKKLVISLKRSSAIWSPEPSQTAIKEIKEILSTMLQSKQTLVNLVLSYTWRGRVAPRKNRLLGHEDDLSGCVLGPEDKFIVSASQDSTCRVWDIRDGKCTHVLKHEDPIIELKMSQSGQLILASTGEWLHLWNINTGTLVKRFEVESHIWCFDMTSDCLYILTGGDQSETVHIWSVLTGEIEGQMDIPPIGSKPTSEGVRHLQIASDDETVLSSCGSVISLWNLRSGKQNRVLKGHEGLVTWCEFTNDIRFVASCGEDAIVRIWDTRSGRCLHKLQGARACIQCGFTPDSEYVIGSSEDNTLAIWDVQTGEMLRQLKGHTDLISGFHITRDGRYIVSWSKDNSVKKWRVYDGRCMRSFDTETSINFCCLTSDARFVITNDTSFALALWNVDQSRRASGSS